MNNSKWIFSKTVVLVFSIFVLSSFVTKREKPTMFIIGDSTVKNGQGDGRNKQWGWGTVIGEFFQEDRINVFNKALGGTSSRTFYNNPKLWQRVLDSIQPGDFVIMQFGHNDTSPVVDTSRARGTFKGNNDQYEIVNNPLLAQKEVVYSYGFYLRRFIQNIHDKGAKAIVCSPIPRDSWNGEKIQRNDYPAWAKQAADQSGASYIPLNELVIDTYEKQGPSFVAENYFTGADHTHTSLEGARLNARLLIDFISSNNTAGLGKYIK